jgi:hypothetical protein
MILDKFVKIKIHSTNYKWYMEKGYGPFHKKDIIDVDIKDLIKSSTVKINSKCDICGEKKYLKYYIYVKSIKNKGIYTCSKCKTYKSEITNMEKYGCKYVLQSKEIKDKSKNTCIKKYGVDNISKVSFIRDDRRNNFKNDNFKNKSKETWINKYGFDNPSKSNIIKNKKIETTLKHYGVENPTQSYELFEKSQITGKRIRVHEQTGLKYRGTYEKDFLDYCFKNNIEVEKGPTIVYYYKNKKRYYHSDFFISNKNLICEIKSDYYLNKYKDINESKKEYTIKNGYDFIFVINKDYSKIL